MMQATSHRQEAQDSRDTFIRCIYIDRAHHELEILMTDAFIYTGVPKD